MTDNVIQFPKHKMGHVPQTRKEIEEDIRGAREEYIKEIVYEYTYDLFSFLNSAGISIADDKYGKDIALIIEATKAVFCKKYNIEHPFHHLANTMFDKLVNEDSIEYTYLNNEEE